MSTYVFVVISPPTTTRPVVISVSHATRPSESSLSTASSTASEIWSATLSGWPSVTDSEVKRNSRATELLDRHEAADPSHVAVLRPVDEYGLERRRVGPGLGQAGRRARAGGEVVDGRQRGVQVDVQEAGRLVRGLGAGARLLEERIVGEPLAAPPDRGERRAARGDDDQALRDAVEDRRAASSRAKLGRGHAAGLDSPDRADVAQPRQGGEPLQHTPRLCLLIHLEHEVDRRDAPAGRAGIDGDGAFAGED